MLHLLGYPDLPSKFLHPFLFKRKLRFTFRSFLKSMMTDFDNKRHTSDHTYTHALFDSFARFGRALVKNEKKQFLDFALIAKVIIQKYHNTSKRNSNFSNFKTHPFLNFSKVSNAPLCQLFGSFVKISLSLLIHEKTRFYESGSVGNRF